MGNKITGGFLRDAVIAAIVAVLGAIGIKYADLPSRVSVVEQSQSDVKDTVKSMDSKIDILLTRVR